MTKLNKILANAVLALTLTASATASNVGRLVLGALPVDDRKEGRIEARSNNYHSVRLSARTKVEIAVAGDGDTDLDLYVYDPQGNLVASDTDNSDDCAVAFRTLQAGSYHVKISNLGYVYNRYVIAVD